MLMDCHYMPWNWCTVTFNRNRKQRTKIGSTYSLWEEIVLGVPQGSLLVALLFNIFLCDLFLSIENNYFTNYADVSSVSSPNTGQHGQKRKMYSDCFYLMMWVHINPIYN